MLLTSLLVMFPALMAYAAASDLLTMTIPNTLSLALVAGFIGVGLVGALPLQAVLLHAGAGAAVLAGSFVLFACGWIGGGDAKLAAATSLWLGFGALPEYLFLTSICGGVLTLVIMAARRAPVPAFALGWQWLERIRTARTVPYGIALAVAAVMVYPHCEIWAAALAR